MCGNIKGNIHWIDCWIELFSTFAKSKNPTNMNRLIFLRIIALLLVAGHLSLSSCKNHNSPNLPEKRLFALMNELSLKTAETPPFALPDSGYIPSVGVKYDEIRAIDPAAPPVVIDIVGNLNNKKTFKLSDIASSVRYVILRPPPDASFSKVEVPSLEYDLIFDSYGIASDDDHIFINCVNGLFCYSAEGQYLYTVVRNQHQTDSNAPRFVAGTDILSNIELINGNLVVQIVGQDRNVQLSFFDVNEMNAQMFFNYQSNEMRNIGVKPHYQRRLDIIFRNRHKNFLMEAQTIFNNNLTITSINGDTLCKFSNYDQPTIDSIMYIRGVGSVPAINTYRVNGNVMLQIGHNDTIFRVMPPNRLIPAYLLNWGNYKPDLRKFVAGGDLDGKFVPRSWLETPRFIFIYYVGRLGGTPTNETDHWAIYDKKTKTLTHHVTTNNFILNNLLVTGVRGTISVLLENDIDPVGMPFCPQGVNHRGEMYMVFSKVTIKRYIENVMNRNDRLQAIYEKMTDDEVCIMIVN